MRHLVLYDTECCATLSVVPDRGNAIDTVTITPQVLRILELADQATQAAAAATAAALAAARQAALDPDATRPTPLSDRIAAVEAAHVRETISHVRRDR